MGRSLDSNIFKIALNEVQKSISEADHELGYMWVELNTRARIHLNTLAFFYCLKARIERETNIILSEKKEMQERKIKLFKEFEGELDYMIQKRDDLQKGGFTEDKMRMEE